MNKTVNINLAGIFFHIDEDAYAKLQHYLDAIKRSLTTTQGSDEIIADIEARIAELFSEKIKTERQVIGNKEVEEVIAIMGQPEDYMLDEEIFEDEPPYRSSKTKKQLFRDTDNSYISGVSSGLGHYLGISAIWVRLIWILLAIFSSGGFILIYIALWIFVPEAKTTADKLAMRGEPVTISNIERKIKEGFDDVSGRMKDIDYEKYGYKARSGAGSAATAIGNAIAFLLKLFVKFIGILLLLIAGTTLISLFIGLFSVGTFGIIDAPWSDYIEMAAIGVPLWVLSLLTFFAVGIPFFFLFILGLKILMKKVRTIGTTAKLVLLAIWLLSVIGLAIIGIQQGTQRAFDGEVVMTQPLPVTTQDTLYLEMNHHAGYFWGHNRGSDVKIDYTDDDSKVMIINDVRLIVRPTNDSLGKIEVTKLADGKDLRDARTRAENIEYETELRNNRLFLNSYLISGIENHYRDQKVRVTLFLPVGITLYADDNTYDYHQNSDYYQDFLKNGEEEHFLRVTSDGIECLDCPAMDENEEDPWQNSDDSRNDPWEETETDTTPTGDFDETGNSSASSGSGSGIGYSLSDQEVSLSITSKTTEDELARVVQEFRTRKKFEDSGELKELSLRVDCKDGFAGETTVSGFILNLNDYGFIRNYQGTEKESFHLGKM